MKKKIFSIALLGLLSTINADISKGLIAHYEFENNMKDSSEYGNDGTQTNSISYSEGFIGKAATFDGTNYITVKERNGFSNMNSPQNEFTLSTYIYIDDNSQGVMYSNTTENGWHSLSISNNHVVFTIRNTSWGGTDLKSEEQIIPNQWYLVTAIYNNGTMLLYINGKLSKTAKFSGGVLSSGNWPNGGVRIGIYYLLDKGYFTGKLDDLRVYNRVLYQDEINALNSRESIKNEKQKQKKLQQQKDENDIKSDWYKVIDKGCKKIQFDPSARGVRKIADDGYMFKDSNGEVNTVVLGYKNCMGTHKLFYGK